MSSTTGRKIKVSVFGESHGPFIGAVIDAPPAGIKLDYDYISKQMSRRAPGQDITATKRKEADIPEFISGVLNGVTTGAPLTLIIKNSNTKSADYESLKRLPRPSHSDYAAYVRFGGMNDICGGGHFSGRLTAPLVAAASVLRPFLYEKGILIGGHVSVIGSAKDVLFNPVNPDNPLIKKLSEEYFAVIDENAKSKMTAEIQKTAENGDSIGGCVELAVTGLNAGLGSPMFDGIENTVSAAIFGVPAVKGVEFGDGFRFAELLGSEANDGMSYDENGKVVCLSNHCGGITGGITNGMPLIVRTVLKPTPSISLVQKTVDLESRKNAEIRVSGRHDPCIVPRALPAVEAALTIAIANIVL